MLASLKRNFTRKPKYIGVETREATREELTWKSVITLGLEFDNPSACAKAVDRVMQVCTPLRTTVENGQITFHRSYNPPVGTLPNMSDWQELCRYNYFRRNGPPFTNFMANIAANDTKMVLNVSHGIGDGGYLLKMIDFVVNDRKIPDEIPCLEIPPEVLMAKELAQLTPDIHWKDDSKLTRIYTKKKPEELKKVTDNDIMEIPGFRSNVKELQCYNKETGKVSGLTESIWTAITLSAQAWNGKLSKIGVTTCLDMRQHMKLNCPEWGDGTVFSIIGHDAPLRPNESLKSLAKSLRENFNKRMQSIDRFAFIRGDPYVDDLMFECSHLGRVKIRPPVKDAWMQVEMAEMDMIYLISVLTYAIDNGHKNELIGTVRFPAIKFHSSEAKILRDSIKFCLEKIPMNMTVQEAYDVIQKYQATRTKLYQ